MEEQIKEIKKMAERNYVLISKNTKSINDNLERINENSYGLEILKDYKKEAKRWFYSFLFVLFLLVIVCIHHFCM